MEKNDFRYLFLPRHYSGKEKIRSSRVEHRLRIRGQRPGVLSLEFENVLLKGHTVGCFDLYDRYFIETKIHMIRYFFLQNFNY